MAFPLRTTNNSSVLKVENVRFVGLLRSGFTLTTTIKRGKFGGYFACCVMQDLEFFLILLNGWKRRLTIYDDEDGFTMEYLWRRP